MNDRRLSGIMLLAVFALGVALVTGLHRQSRAIVDLAVNVNRRQQFVENALTRMAAAAPGAEAGQPVPSQPAVTTSDTRPTVAFLRPGLLTEAERQLLTTKLTDPIGDYYNDTERQAVAILIEVPTNMGMPYGVTIITANGGTADFFYGTRGRDVGYWMPDCASFGDCAFTDAFQRKYPEIVRQYNKEQNGE